MHAPTSSTASSRSLSSPSHAVPMRRPRRTTGAPSLPDREAARLEQFLARHVPGFRLRPAASPATADALLAADVHLVDEVDEDGEPRVVQVRPGAEALPQRQRRIVAQFESALSAVALRLALVCAPGEPARCVSCREILTVDDVEAFAVVRGRPCVELAHFGACFERAAGTPSDEERLGAMRAAARSLADARGVGMVADLAARASGAIA